jgi:TRAP-type transport system small permease protein
MTAEIMQHHGYHGFGRAALRLIDGILCAVCAVVIVAFSAMLIAQVGLRQVGHPLFWVEELCQYLMVYLCFLGSAIAWGRREHLTVEFLPSLLGEGGRRALLIVVDGVVLVFAAWATLASAEFALFSMRKISISLDAPVGYGYIGAPIGFGIIALQSLIFMGCGRGNPGFVARERELEEVGM